MTSSDPHHGKAYVLNSVGIWETICTLIKSKKALTWQLGKYETWVVSIHKDHCEGSPMLKKRGSEKKWEKSFIFSDKAMDEKTIEKEADNVSQIGKDKRTQDG